jgi:hypothetical protein
MTDDVLTLVRMANTVPELTDLDPEEIRESRATIDEALRLEHTPGMAYARVPQQRFRPILIAVAVAVVVALIIGIPALLSRSSEELPVVDEPVPTTVTPTTVPTTASATTAAPPQTTEATAPPTTVVELPEVPELGIARIELPQSEPAAVDAVTAGGPGLIAVGGVEVRPEVPAVAGGVVEGAIWVSADGQSWTAIDGSGLFWLTEEQADEGQSQHFTDLTSGPAGLVAVGIEGYDGMAWTSADGLTWSRAADDEALGGNDIQEIRRVIAGGPGYVAVGRNGSTAGVWTSPDGETWTLIENEVFGSYSEPADAFDVAALPSGLVVVGYGGELTPDRWGLSWGGDTPAVWVSRDGLAWDRLSLDAFGDAEPFFFESVEVSPDAFFLESSEGDVLQQWTSMDGRTWTRTGWPPCEPEEPRVILFAEYPGAECRGVGYLDAPDSAEVETNRMTKVGPLLIVTGGIYIPDEDIYQDTMWIAALDD